MSEQMIQDMVMDLGNTIAQLNIDMSSERVNYRSTIVKLEEEIKRLKSDKEQAEEKIKELENKKEQVKNEQ